MPEKAVTAMISAGGPFNASPAPVSWPRLFKKNLDKQPSLASLRGLTPSHYPMRRRNHNPIQARSPRFELYSSLFLIIIIEGRFNLSTTGESHPEFEKKPSMNII